MAGDRPPGPVVLDQDHAPAVRVHQPDSRLQHDLDDLLEHRCGVERARYVQQHLQVFDAFLAARLFGGNLQGGAHGVRADLKLRAGAQPQNVTGSHECVLNPHVVDERASR